MTYKAVFVPGVNFIHFLSGAFEDLSLLDVVAVATTKSSNEAEYVNFYI